MIFARDPRAFGRLPFFISLCGNPARTRRRPSLRERVSHRCTLHVRLPSGFVLSFSCSFSLFLFPFPFRISFLRPRCVYPRAFPSSLFTKRPCASFHRFSFFFNSIASLPPLYFLHSLSLSLSFLFSLSFPLITIAKLFHFHCLLLRFFLFLSFDLLLYLLSRLSFYFLVEHKSSSFLFILFTFFPFLRLLHLRSFFAFISCHFLFRCRLLFRIACNFLCFL